MADASSGRPSSSLELGGRRPISCENFFGMPNFGERSACGVGAVADRHMRATHELVELALSGLCELNIRAGNIGEDGDGAGLILRTAGLRRFLERHLVPGRQHVPEGERLMAGNVFFPIDESLNTSERQRQLDQLLRNEGLMPLNWRRVPTQEEALGPRARGKREVWQLLFARGSRTEKGAKEALHRVKIHAQAQLPEIHIVSMQVGTVTYKYMARGDRLSQFFSDDFNDPDFRSDAIGFHTRYSTVTTSGPEKAHFFRIVGHNGEINGIQAIRDAVRDIEGNLNIRHTVLAPRGASDSMDMDRVVELFTAHGVPLDETLRRMLRPAKDDIERMPPSARQYFLAAKRALGPLSAFGDPAAVIGLDENQVVAILGNMGVRPMRLTVSRSGLVVFSSEVGAPYIPREERELVYQLDAGEMMVLEDGELFFPEQATRKVIDRTKLNYADLASHKTILPLPKAKVERVPEDRKKLIARLNLFGADRNLLTLLEEEIALGTEPTQGMSSTGPLPVFSKFRPNLFKYVLKGVPDITNPPFDSIREAGAFDLGHFLGRSPQIHEHSSFYDPHPQYAAPLPILSDEEFQGIVQEGAYSKIPAAVIDTSFQGEGVDSLIEAVEAIKTKVIKLARNHSGAQSPSLIILSDREAGEEGRLYVPSLLLVSLLHHELTHQGLRRNVKLIIDSGEIFEAHDAATLIGFGADALNPYLLWKLLESDLVPKNGDPEKAKNQVMKTFAIMLKKFMAKSGVASIDEYRAARPFRIFGIHPEVTSYFMPDIESLIGGLRLQDIFEDLVWRGQLGGTELKRTRDIGEYPAPLRQALEAVGFNPKDSWIEPEADAYDRYLTLLAKNPPVFLRDCLDFNYEGVTPVSREKLMSAQEFIEEGHIVGAAMSHGALFRIAHRGIARGFNKLNGYSNCGEGGEDARRYKGGEWEKDRSKIKQIGTARFGVDVEYIADADEVEIKFSQGVKPREGGDLLGEEIEEDNSGNIVIKRRGKVPLEIAAIRHVQPGQRLTSPPPQISVFSIEDLRDFIGAIRAVNPTCKVSVKIAPSVDLGSVAVGIAKAGADVICISGFKGKTGAAQHSSINYTGAPVETGVAEAHQALVANGLRSFVRIRADEGVKSGNHIVKLMLLGANEVAEGQALLIAGERCIDCKDCPDGVKCPSGICHQSDETALRLGMDKKRRLKLADSLDKEHEERIVERCAEAVSTFLLHQAEEALRILAKLGFENPEDAVGRVDRLKQIFPTEETKKVDLQTLLRDMSAFQAQSMEANTRARIEKSLRPEPVNPCNQTLLDAVKALNGNPEAVLRGFTLKPKDRWFGASLSGAIVKKEIIPPEKGIVVETEGDAGQRYGFALASQVTLRHTGYLNDYGGEAARGKIVVIPSRKTGESSQDSLVGNATCLGAIGVTFYAAGRAGQRLGCRNSGSTIVTEGCGKYPLEYMTEGTAIIMGKIGNVIGTGMTGGEAFLLDDDGDEALQNKLHRESVKVAPMGRADEAKLLSILQDYYRETESERARFILENWETEKLRFRKIVSTFRSSYTVARERARAAQGAEAISIPT